MPYENIEVTYPNLCRGPIKGSLCNINFDNPIEPTLDVISYTGSKITSFSILGGASEDSLIFFEYIGPKALDYIINDSFIYLMEKVDEAHCVLKIFRFNTSFGTLDLVHLKNFFDYADYSFDINACCVEYYDRKFSEHSDRGLDYIYLNNVSRLNPGDTIFLGPSNDPEYVGKYDVMVVRDIIPTENKVRLTSYIRNQYVKGDNATFAPNIYIFSKRGVGGEDSIGSLLKVSNVTYNVVNRDTKYIYQMLNKARWCPLFSSIGMQFNANIVFTNPYNYYTNIKSLFLNNSLANKKEFYEVYDTVYVDAVALRLSKKVTKRDNVGNYVTINWDYYNYSEQTLVPYANCINYISNNAYVVGANTETVVNIKVTDQFGIGLRDVELVCSIVSGDIEGRLDPLSGYSVSDINGEATIGFTSGIMNSSYELSIVTNEGSAYTGTVNVFSSTMIWNEVNFDGCSMRLRQISNYCFGNRWPNKLIRQLTTVSNTPSMSIRAFSYFTVPGGNWVPSGLREGLSTFLWFLPDKGEHQGLNGCGAIDEGAGFNMPQFNVAPINYEFSDRQGYVIPNRITTIDMSHTCNFVSTMGDLCSYHLLEDTLNHESIRDYEKRNWVYELRNPWVDWSEDFFENSTYFSEGHFKKPGGPYPTGRLNTFFKEYNLQVSQLNYSLHNYYVDGAFNEELFTYVDIDQFIFVQDAKPVFYSGKNPVFTDVWLRLRPFAHSLDPETLNMRIRKVSYFTDTGIINITNLVETSTFDASGGLTGIEILYDPTVDFEYNSICYVYVYIEDFAGNEIEIDYWFTLIHDYRIPYIDNLKPDRLEQNVDPATTIYFELMDDQTGVDIDSLIVTVNTKIVFPQRIEKVSRHKYIIEYTNHRDFRHGTNIDIGVFVGDLATQQNWLRDGYTFSIQKSEGVYLTSFLLECKRDVPRFNDVSFIALDMGDGVDPDKLRLQVANTDVTKNPNTKIIPIIYKII